MILACVVIVSVEHAEIKEKTLLPLAPNACLTARGRRQASWNEAVTSCWNIGDRQIRRERARLQVGRARLLPFLPFALAAGSIDFCELQETARRRRCCCVGIATRNMRKTKELPAH